MDRADILASEDDIRKWFETGVEKLKGGDKTNALRLFLIVLEYWPRCGEAYNNIGIIYFDAVNYNEACKYFLKSLEIYPGNNRFLHNIAMCFAKLGRYEKAIDYYRKAIDRDNNYVHSYYNLAGVYRDIGSYEKSLPLYEQVVKFESDLCIDAQFMIDSIKGERRDKAPPVYLERLFDQYASYYDEHMLNTLSCNSVTEFGKILQKIGCYYNFSLDVGCGTGEVGRILKEYSTSIVGLDLSAEMINCARGKGYYNRCIVGNILKDNTLEKLTSYDCITLCDVLIYFGNVESLFKSIYHKMKPRGDFILNFEDGEIDDYRLESTGRFIHGLNYIQHQLAINGFDVKRSYYSYSRIEEQKKVSSIFVHARKHLKIKS